MAVCCAGRSIGLGQSSYRKADSDYYRLNKVPHDTVSILFEERIVVKWPPEDEVSTATESRITQAPPAFVAYALVRAVLAIVPTPNSFTRV